MDFTKADLVIEDKEMDFTKADLVDEDKVVKLLFSVFGNGCMLLRKVIPCALVTAGILLVYGVMSFFASIYVLSLNDDPLPITRAVFDFFIAIFAMVIGVVMIMQNKRYVRDINLYTWFALTALQTLALIILIMEFFQENGVQIDRNIQLAIRLLILIFGQAWILIINYSLYFHLMRFDNYLGNGFGYCPYADYMSHPAINNQPPKTEEKPDQAPPINQPPKTEEKPDQAPPINQPPKTEEKPDEK